MRISLVKNKNIQNIILPNKIEGTYWISETDNYGIKRNLIAIEAKDNKWKLINNKEVYIKNGKALEPEIILEVGKFYKIYNELEKNELLIYCSDIYVKYNYFLIGTINESLKISGTENENITFLPLENNSVEIKYMENKFYILTEKSKEPVYINNELVTSYKSLKIGDVIFIKGLKIIFMMAIENSNYVVFLGVNNSVIPDVIVNLESYNKNLLVNSQFEETEEETEFPLYDEKEYYYKTPRFISRIKPLNMQIDAPPSKIEEQENSILLTIGPMITMSMMSLMTGYTALNNVLNGTTTWSSAMPSLVISAAMVASVVIWPIFTKNYQKKQRVKKEQFRQDKYKAYIEEKKEIIRIAVQEQSNILINNYPNNTDVINMIIGKYISIWQRRIKDADYLEFNLGKGIVPMNINIKFPDDHFTMAEDDLKNMVKELGKEPKILNNVPVVISLLEKYILGLIGKEDYTTSYIKKLLLQAMAFHSYDDLKIVILTDEENEYKWKYFKNLPHLYNDEKSIRYFATTNNEYKEVCYNLEMEFKKRTSKNKIDTEELKEVYLIITDSYKKIREYDAINSILESKEKTGFSIIIIDNKITDLPDQCMSFIEVGKDKGKLYNNTEFIDNLEFAIENIDEDIYDNCIKTLANIPIEIENSNQGQLVNKLGFLEMYDVGKIEQLNSTLRWKNNNPVLNLQVPVGVGKNQEIINIDLHEKYHGPHGLIAGMTGSGKSEFIITYILSAAVNYHPYEVQFVLIDYKGGGLAGAFENVGQNIKLPHLVGTITNLDENEIKRSLMSIESELKRRQTLFNKAREISNESTIDIYKYQKMYRDGLLEEPMSHLFIISDEFAELKVQQPEFMSQLISTARIGRSLGVHLILATQKPSGVVDPQIWSNSRFRVCLKVQDKNDSNEIIKMPDAAYLKQVGRFYFQVGYNEVFTLGQSAFSGEKYIPNEKVNKTIDTSIEFIDNIGYKIKSVKTKKNQENLMVNYGEELSNLVKYLDESAKLQQINVKPLWLNKIPPFITIDSLSRKYNFKADKNLEVIIGEYDIPQKQQQKMLLHSFDKKGNVIIYGASGSGKEHLISTIIYSSMINYDASIINFYIIDFGSGSLKMYNNSPVVGDILSIENEESIENLFKMLIDVIEERKIILEKYNGDYSNYIASVEKPFEKIVIIINNFESYLESFEKYENYLIKITRECTKYGIYFILSTSTPNGIKLKIKQNFASSYILQQNNKEDYNYIIGTVNKNYPSKIFGRGIIKEEESVFEFQTASIADSNELTMIVKDKCNYLKENSKFFANKVPVLPAKVSKKDIQKELNKDNQLVIGINKTNLDIVKFDFMKNFITYLPSISSEFTNIFVNNLIKQIISNENTSLLVMNAMDYKLDPSCIDKYQHNTNNFDETLKNIYEYSKKMNEFYKNNNYDKDLLFNQTKTYCVILGFESFKNKLNEESIKLFEKIVENLKDLEILGFILVDSTINIKKYEFEQWYKSNVNTMNYIWFGNGISEQFSFKLNVRPTEVKTTLPENFCFVVKNGIPEIVKYIEEYDLD